MMFTIVLGLLMVKYLDVARQSAKISNATYHASAAMNIAETGLEEAIWSINKYSGGDTTAFSSAEGWTTSGNETSKTISAGLLLGSNSSGTLKVYVRSFNGAATAPKIVTRARLTLPGNISVEKWVEIDLVRRSRFASGLVAKKNITFNGNYVNIDSWDSHSDAGTTNATPYDASLAHDHGSVGSVEISSSISVNNADIWGTASVGGNNINAISVGANGRVGPYGTATGQMPGASTDFSANLDIDSQPAGSSGLVITSNSDIPSSLSSDPSNPTIIVANSLNLQNSVLTIKGYMKLILSASALTQAINIGGNSGNLVIGGTNASGLPIPSGITIYTAGDIDIGGQGVANGYTNSSGTFITGSPLNLTIYGTSTASSPQTIKIAGNGALCAVVYAPNANMTVGGGGSDTNDLFGSFVCNAITMTGHTNFHYDESLARVGGANSYKINYWRELISGADRSPYMTAMAF
jgi:hypothetical protein